MSKQVEFYYDYGSPAAYLAWTQLPTICERNAAALVYRPVLLGGIFKATGNSTPVSIEPKGAWMFDDLSRFASRYDVAFNMNPHFIINTLAIMRGATWALEAGRIGAYNTAMFEAVWVNGRNMSEPDQIRTALNEAGFDAEDVFMATQDPRIKTALINATNAAVKRGVFGVPTMFAADQMHFGQDRLDWVEQALAA